MADNKIPAEHTVHVVGRNVLVTPAMKQHAMDKIAKIERLQNQMMDIQVVMDIEHLDHMVSIVARFAHFKVKAEAKSTDMYASIDLAVDRLQKQLTRWKDRIHSHMQKKLSVVDMEVNVLQRPYNELEEFNADIEIKNREEAKKTVSFPKITGSKTLPLKELNTEEAIMKMELSNDNFLVYRSEEDRKLKVIYRRKDGNYGIIQPNL